MHLRQLLGLVVVGLFGGCSGAAEKLAQEREDQTTTSVTSGESSTTPVPSPTTVAPPAETLELRGANARVPAGWIDVNAELKASQPDTDTGPPAAVTTWLIAPRRPRVSIGTISGTVSDPGTL